MMLASGTRGDVQPFLALALGLRRVGVPVVLGAAPRFRSLVEGRGVEFAALEGNPSDLMAGDSRSMPVSLRGGAARGAAATVRFLRDAQPEYRRMLESAAALCGLSGAAAGAGIRAAVHPPARAVLVGLASTWGLSIAEALGVPAVLCMLQPFGRTRAFPSALLPFRFSLGAAYNGLSYRVVEQSMWLPWRRTINEWRRRMLGLAPLPLWGGLPASGFPCLYGFSPAVAPAPPDWPAGHLVTGYWFLEDAAGWAPAPGLQRFLASGVPPLYIGFGSMGMQGGIGALKVIEKALVSSGLRAVVSAGAGPGLPRPAEGSRCLFVGDEVSHSWLFPRMAAVMHHGGAGTTAMGLRAGVPSIIVPTAADQYFWGERVARNGAGPKPLRPRDLTAAALARVFTRVVTDQGMKEKARLLGGKIRAENGVERAVEALVPLIGSSDPARLQAPHRPSS